MRKFGFEEKKMKDIKSLAGKGAWVMMQRSFKEEIRDEKTKKAMTKEFIDAQDNYLEPGETPKAGADVGGYTGDHESNYAKTVGALSPRTMGVDLRDKF